eukprot:792638-Pelagomonas_calceolata.AAC.5
MAAHNVRCMAAHRADAWLLKVHRAWLPGLLQVFALSVPYSFLFVQLWKMMGCKRWSEQPLASLCASCSPCIPPLPFLAARGIPPLAFLAAPCVTARSFQQQPAFLHNLLSNARIRILTPSLPLFLNPNSSFSRARSRRRSHSNLLNQLDLEPPAQDKAVMYHEVEIKLVTDPETDRKGLRTCFEWDNPECMIVLNNPLWPRFTRVYRGRSVTLPRKACANPCSVLFGCISLPGKSRQI